MVEQTQSPGIGGGLKGLPRKGDGHQQLLVLAPSVVDRTKSYWWPSHSLGSPFTAPATLPLALLAHLLALLACSTASPTLSL